MAIDAGRERAPYASDPRLTRGRLHAEPESSSRNPFRRDCDRIIHSAAFRRLKHKTQVFVAHEGDHYRTRLTHTLEVTQIARSLARALGLDEDLAEALALAHDLGHPPFGHAGETALDGCLADVGGFDHNVQTVRMVTALERRYAAFDGLNLSWETLEGLIKHNGPLTKPNGEPVTRYAEKGVPVAFRRQALLMDIPLDLYGSAEAQAAAIADDIAYDAHDLDDGLRAGLFEIDDLHGVPLVGDLLAEVDAAYPTLEAQRRVHELIRRVITRMIEDVAVASGRRLQATAPKSAQDVRSAPVAVVAFSPEMADADQAIKGFLFPRMYRHSRVMRVVSEAQDVVRNLFRHYLAAPETMPSDWLAESASGGDDGRHRVIGDFIAGMTDTYALAEHARFFDSTPELR